ncbi:ergothioneine biosynthesis protein EgtB [Fluviicola sp.]|uniref:ergothioneine biosynthesis protein EgtB n=1 Tax=Fluviicola sp. TaxID=1917219 RepID=UPI0031D972B3
MHLREKYLEVRNRTEQLCRPLQVEDYVPQPVPFASPPKWHLAHTTWFFEEMILKKNLNGYKEFHPDFGFLFNSYYNTIGERTFRADRGNITRPGVSEVYQYRAYVDQGMNELLSHEISQELSELIELGLNHEQQHQELLITDLKYTLGHNPIFPVYDESFNLLADHNTESGWVSMEEGIYEIGHDGGSFCFDNELNKHKVYLQPFDISKSLVTNGEYIEFIDADGYSRFDCWLDEGWSWLNENKITNPLYWHKINGKWHYFTLAGLKEVDPDAILSHVSYYEAQAFASWKGMRLPTEFEWEASCAFFGWGKRWEWTNSAYLPYPGFKTAAGAVGEYNGKFMINQMVLRGASVATSLNHSRRTYRNFFHPHFQWQYSGIRLAK